MTERTALGEAILTHWRAHCPQMVKELETKKRLDQSVLEAQEQTSDLLYELVSVRKMDYQAAWEVATREWAFLPEEDRPKPDGPQQRTTPSAKSQSNGSKSGLTRKNRQNGRRGTSE